MYSVHTLAFTHRNDKILTNENENEQILISFEIEFFKAF